MQTAQIAEMLPIERAPLRRFALSMTRNIELAEDLVQDTMERALIKAHLFDGVNLRGWLWTMCRRIYFNDLRRQKIRGPVVTLDEAPNAAVTSAAAQELNVQIRQVVDAFKRLPVGDKIVLSLVVLDGLSYVEAAAALCVPVGTIRSRLSRARERLMQETSMTADQRAGEKSSSPRPSLLQ